MLSRWFRRHNRLRTPAAKAWHSDPGSGPSRMDIGPPRATMDDMRPCISEAATLPGTFADDVEAFADAGCPRHGSLADQAGNPPRNPLRRRHPQAARRPSDDPGGGFLPGRTSALPGRTAQGPLRPFQAPPRPVPDLRHSHAAGGGRFRRRRGRDRPGAGGGFARRKRPSGRRRSTCGWPWSSAARPRSAPASTRPWPSSPRAASRTSASTSTCSITTPARASSRTSSC